MWAQLITLRLKPGKEGELLKMDEQFRSAEQPGSGFVRSTALQDQDDPTKVHILVIFESEEVARAREKDPRREELTAAARATMAEITEGPPEFANLNVVSDRVAGE